MTPKDIVATYCTTVSDLVRSERPDLSMRQMAILLIVYTDAAPQTVRGLAHSLDVSKPAVTRALDRLAEYDFIRREVDANDRRSVLIRRTPQGNAYLREVRSILTRAFAPAPEAVAA